MCCSKDPGQPKKIANKHIRGEFILTDKEFKKSNQDYNVFLLPNWQRWKMIVPSIGKDAITLPKWQRKKSYDQPRQHIKKQRHYSANKVCLVKAMVFPVVMYGCESWAIKKVEYQRIDAFELWCWRRLLRVPWTARRSSQSILKEISPEYSVEGLMLKLKLQYFGHLMRRTDSLEKTLMLGKFEGGRRRGQ